LKLLAQIRTAGITLRLKLRKNPRENPEMQPSAAKAGLILHLLRHD